MTLYEINQQAYSQLPDMTEDQIESATYKITNFLLERKANYYMLLNVNGRYYTLFTYKENPLEYRMAQKIISIIKSLGSIRGIDINEEDKMIEFWIHDNTEKICKMYALFNYDEGVIKVG